VLAPSQHDLALENFALRHQITVLNRQTRWPKLRPLDRYIWIMFKRCWPDWKSALMIFQPETVIGWQRTGFRLFWAGNPGIGWGDLERAGG